jgi:hypothetical protein
MSTAALKKKSRKKTDKNASVDNGSFSPPRNLMVTEFEEKPKQTRRNRSVDHKNEAVKQRLTLIIDLLSFSEDTFNDITMKHNVAISVKHIQEIVDSL